MKYIGDLYRQSAIRTNVVRVGADIQSIYTRPILALSSHGLHTIRDTSLYARATGAYMIPRLVPNLLCSPPGILHPHELLHLQRAAGGL